jgi:hypothetical protein
MSTSRADTSRWARPLLGVLLIAGPGIAAWVYRAGAER